MKHYECRSFEEPQISWETRLGFYAMQSAYWSSIILPSCEHPVTLDEAVVLPHDTWAFDGFGKPDLGDRPQSCVNVALIAGDKSARWIMATEAYGANIHNQSHTFLRSRDCCFECAINMVRNAESASTVCLLL